MFGVWGFGLSAVGITRAVSSFKFGSAGIFEGVMACRSEKRTEGPYKGMESVENPTRAAHKSLL